MHSALAVSIALLVRNRLSARRLLYPPLISAVWERPPPTIDVRLVYHALNRGNNREDVFGDDGDSPSWKPSPRPSAAIHRGCFEPRVQCMSFQCFNAFPPNAIECVELG